MRIRMRIFFSVHSREEKDIYGFVNPFTGTVVAVPSLSI